jgi:hypothetical protein
LILTRHKNYKNGQIHTIQMLRCGGNIPQLQTMMYLKSLKTNNGIRKVCALVAATLILPVVMAYAKDDNDKNNGEGKGDKHVYSVPEGGPGVVLLMATIGAILLFSARRPSRSNAS